MMEWLAPLTALLLGNAWLPGQVAERAATLFLEPPAYDSSERAVSNWRREALASLTLVWPVHWNFTLGPAPERLPRCIRLNNYWCIKSAGWNGEIAADGEGHVAFASVEEGALVAAALLRRYYVDYRLVSARAIVARWAPAECTLTAGARRQTLARHGLQNTLRARWLARNRPGFTGKARPGAPPRRSAVAARPVPMLRAPAIAVGMGERSPASVSTALAALDRAPPRPVGGASCASEDTRMANYATRIAASLAASPGDDLALFDTYGMPTERLAPALKAMAAVEIGPYLVKPGIVRAAVDALRDRLAAQKPAPEAGPVNRADP